MAAIAAHGWTTRDLALEGDEGRCAAGWQRLAEGEGVAREHLVALRQVHGATVVSDSASGAEADALVSSNPDRLLTVRVADCVPLLVADRRTGAVAAVHAGWRGTASGIAAAAIRRLQAEFGSTPSDLVAAIGPSIRVCCYEVGPGTGRCLPRRRRHRPRRGRVVRAARWIRSAPARRGTRQPRPAGRRGRPRRADPRFRSLHRVSSGAVPFVPTGQGPRGTTGRIHPCASCRRGIAGSPLVGLVTRRVSPAVLHGSSSRSVLRRHVARRRIDDGAAPCGRARAHRRGPDGVPRRPHRVACGRRGRRGARARVEDRTRPHRARLRRRSPRRRAAVGRQPVRGRRHAAHGGRARPDGATRRRHRRSTARHRVALARTRRGGAVDLRRALVRGAGPPARGSDVDPGGRAPAPARSRPPAEGPARAL